MISEDKLRTVVEEAVTSHVRPIIKDTVRETLISLGADADNPIEMQKDFQHMRHFRETADAAKRKGVLAAVTVLVTGGIAWFWMSIKTHIGLD